MEHLVEQDTLTEPGILLIARFLWFVPILCTTLKQCLVSLYQQVGYFQYFQTILLNFLIFNNNNYEYFFIIYIGIVCPARERADSAHPPAPPCY